MEFYAHLLGLSVIFYVKYCGCLKKDVIENDLEL